MKDALGSVQSVLVLGGGSDIALATVRQLVASGRTKLVLLAGRSPQQLAEPAEELRAAGAPVEVLPFDARDLASHDGFVADVFDRHGDIDLVLVAFGVLGDQAAAEHDRERAVEIVETNFTGAVSVLVPIADRLCEQGHGTIVVLSSVAGERVRRSNFVYGASKAGLDGFTQGLGDALHGSGVEVIVVRPGFVRSKMTAGMREPPATTTPEAVAAAIVHAVGRGTRTVWVPPTLRYVMAVFRHLPRPLFRRLPV